MSNLNKPQIIEVRTDLPSINPHDYLDFQLEFKFYLELISFFNGYISQEAFFSYMKSHFRKTQGQTKTILKKMIQGKWVGKENIGNRYKILYLKRKARVCLEGKNLSDLRSPTNRIIIRTLLLERFAVDQGVTKYHYNVAPVNLGYNPNDIVFADIPRESYLKNSHRIVLIDLTRKTARRYSELIRYFYEEDERFKDKKVFITFLTYTKERGETLRNVFKDEQLKNLKDTLYRGHDRLRVNAKNYDVLSYFDNKEPLI